MIKRIAPWLVLILVAAGAYLWWRRSGSVTATTLTFRTAAVQRGDVTLTVTGSGTLSALTTVDVGSQVSGNIAKLYADYNDAVTAGQLLAEIDPSTYESRVFQVQADLLSAEATLELRQLNLKRSGDLLAKKLIPQSDYDDAAVAVRQQEAATKRAQAAVQSAKVDLDRCKIYSPVNGVVLKRAVDLGQTVQASYAAPTLFTIAQDLRKMEISATISEADIGTVETGQSVSFTVDAFPSRKFEGTVRQVRNNSTVANNVVTYPVIVTVANDDMKLRPGMTANIVIATTKRTNALRVPNSALRFKAPEGATVIAAAGAPAAAGGAAGGMPSLDSLPPEIRQRILATYDKNGDGKLDDDERKAMTAAMSARAAQAGGGGFGPPGGGMGGGMGGGGMAGRGGGGFARPASGSSQPGTIYVARGTPNAAGFVTGELQQVNVTTGVSDSTHTEILTGVEEGAVVVLGTVTAQQAAATTTGTNNIFGPPRPPGASGASGAPRR